MPYPWSPSFRRIPDDDWTRQPLGELALNYDTVENHGWYSNLELSVEQLAAVLEPGQVLVDYSAGTGIFTQRLLAELGDRPVGIVLVDASPKFLRLALEKFEGESRVAFRHLRYLKEHKRLQFLDEVLGATELGGPADALGSTNAVHLYYDLPDTLASWHRLLKPGGRTFVQSGNIRNPAAGAGEWIIDETVEAIHEASVSLVESEPRWSGFRAVLKDSLRMNAHAAVRRKFFLPVRELSHYTEALEAAGFRVSAVETRRIEALVDDWFAFLATYHEGVLGWAGGSLRVEGEEPSAAVLKDRQELIRAAMERVFEGKDRFPCCWTYLSAVRA